MSSSNKQKPSKFPPVVGLAVAVLSFLVAAASMFISLESLKTSKRIKQAEIYAETQIVDLNDDSVKWELKLTNISDTPAYNLYVFLPKSGGEGLGDHEWVAIISLLPAHGSRSVVIEDKRLAEIFMLSSPFERHLFVGYRANDGNSYSQRIPVLIDSRIVWSREAFDEFRKADFSSDADVVAKLKELFPTHFADD